VTNDPYEDGVEVGQWREKVREHDRRLNAINGSIDRAEEAITGLREDVRGIGVKVGVYAGLAAFLASTVGSIVTGVVI
jgi:hypothetical protein